MKFAKYAVWAGMFLGALGVACLVPSLGAQQSAKTAVEAQQKAHVEERLMKAMPAEHKGVAPSFVLDPAWPQPLPHHWVIGDVGGIAVDKHDNIWVYQRPRALTNTDSGAQGVAGKNAKGQPISAMGFPRPFGQTNDCCMPAPSVLEFDKAGNLLQAWGGPGDPGFLDTKCARRTVASGLRVSMASTSIRTTLSILPGMAKRVISTASIPWAPNFGNDSQILKFKTDGTFVYQIGTAGAKGPNSNDTDGGVNGTPEPFWPADMVVDPKTNLMYIADGYGNRRVLIVDAATGKYVGHFGAYGQNPVVGENGVAGEDAGEGAGSWPVDYKAGNLKPMFFRSPMHCAKLANDGLLVCLRSR